jgi:hypothetical protein
MSSDCSFPSRATPLVPFAFDLNVSVSWVMVDSWDTYRNIIESGNNSVVVNTHDEYVPVPQGYEKEVWTGKIADFMFNRWGTWVQAGGYPFYRVWYQNGTTEEWGEAGFRELMKYINKPNITCTTSPESYGEDMSLGVKQALVSFSLADPASGHNINIANFDWTLNGFSLRHSDIGDRLAMVVYRGSDGNESYYDGAVVRFRQNATASCFGTLVYLGAWNFSNGCGYTYPNSDSIAGFVPTAVAVYWEFGAVLWIYGRNGWSASEAIHNAENEGRTNGLGEAKIILLQALDSYAAGEYKQVQAYAEKSKATADKSTAPLTLPNLLGRLPPLPVAAATIVIAYSTGIWLVSKRKERRKNP